MVLKKATVYINEDIVYNVCILVVTTAQFCATAEDSSCDTDSVRKVGHTFVDNTSQRDGKWYCCSLAVL